MTADLVSKIRDIPDFPKPGIQFKDITTLLKDGPSFKAAIDGLLTQIGDRKVDAVVGMESRGFIFAAPIAYNLGVGFAPVRKLGKLPSETISAEYALEYGSNTLELHVDGVRSGQKVLVVDDLLATGGTVEACCKLLEKAGAEIVGCAFLIALDALKGAQRVAPHQSYCLLHY